MDHSTYANPHPVNSNFQINKLIGKKNHDSNNNDIRVLHSNYTKYVCKQVMNIELQTPTDHEIFDSVTTGHFSFPMHQWLKTAYNNSTMHHPSSWLHDFFHPCLLDILQIDFTSQLAHIVPDLAHSSLKSVKWFCEEGCNVENDGTNCYVYNNNNNNNIILMDQGMKR